MSLLNDLLGAGLTTWRDRLLPASFRGATFFVADHEEQSGRRVAVHEFPLRDQPVTEDLGAAARRFTLQAYVLGDDYFVDRDALRRAAAQAGPGTLIHPYLGSLQVQLLGCGVKEARESGRLASFSLTFVEAGTAAVSYATDTAGGVLAAIERALPLLREAFAIGMLIATHPGFLGQLLTFGVEGLVGDMLGLPANAIAGLVSDIQAISAAGDSVALIAPAVTTAILAVADNLVAMPALGVDPTGGLATLAAFTPMAAFPPGTGPASQQTGLTQTGLALTGLPLTALQQAGLGNAIALQDLVRGATACAIASLYAQTDFTSANMALAARTQIAALVSDRTDAAAAAGDDASYDAWQSLGAAVITDLVTRAQSLPSLAAYTVPASRTALALSQRLYGDGGRAEALIDLGDVLHPAFMPRTGPYLEYLS